MRLVSWSTEVYAKTKTNEEEIRDIRCTVIERAYCLPGTRYVVPEDVYQVINRIIVTLQSVNLKILFSRVSLRTS